MTELICCGLTQEFRFELVAKCEIYREAKTVQIVS